jgi:hypothetical protein
MPAPIQAPMQPVIQAGIPQAPAQYPSTVNPNLQH